MATVDHLGKRGFTAGTKPALYPDPNATIFRRKIWIVRPPPPPIPAPFTFFNSTSTRNSSSSSSACSKGAKRLWLMCSLPSRGCAYAQLRDSAGRSPPRLKATVDTVLGAEPPAGKGRCRRLCQPPDAHEPAEFGPPPFHAPRATHFTCSQCPFLRRRSSSLARDYCPCSAYAAAFLPFSPSFPCPFCVFRIGNLVLATLAPLVEVMIYAMKLATGRAPLFPTLDSPPLFAKP